MEEYVGSLGGIQIHIYIYIYIFIHVYMNVLQEAGPLNCTKKNIDINFDLGFQVLGWDFRVWCLSGFGNEF